MLPELTDNLSWKIYEWEGSKYLGIMPAEGHEWRFNFGVRNTSPYSVKLIEHTEEGLLSAAAELHGIIYSKTLVLPPLTKLIVEEAELDELYSPVE